MFENLKKISIGIIVLSGGLILVDSILKVKQKTKIYKKEYGYKIIYNKNI